MYAEKFPKLMRKMQEHGETNDCGVKCLAIVCRTNYENAHRVAQKMGRKPRKGTPWNWQTLRLAGNELGYVFKPCRADLHGKTITTAARDLQRGYYAVLVSRGRHVVAVHNGQIHDWTEGRRHRVYAVWKVEKAKP